MIYITGDKHGNFLDVYKFCKENNTNKDDLLIVLGDAGINYFLNARDYTLKEELESYPITFFCVHGNHEERPENIYSYETKYFHEGIVSYEVDYPHILFAKDAEVYDFNGRKTIVIGGAYSVDKYFRLMRGFNWYPSEQPSEETKEKVKRVLELRKNQIDVILSHTCPYKYLPREMFLQEIKNVDNTTEYFLDEIDDDTEYQDWYCGHFHTDKKVKKLTFMYNDIKKF